MQALFKSNLVGVISHVSEREKKDWKAAQQDTRVFFLSDTASFLVPFRVYTMNNKPTPRINSKLREKYVGTTVRISGKVVSVSTHQEGVIDNKRYWMCVRSLPVTQPLLKQRTMAKSLSSSME